MALVVLGIETLAWLVAAAINVFASDAWAPALALLAFCGVATFGLVVRNRITYLGLLGFVGLCLLVYELQLLGSEANLAPLLARVYPVAFAVFALAMLLPGTRRAYGFEDPAPRSESEATARRWLRRGGAVAVHSLLLPVAGILVFTAVLYGHDAAVGVRRPYAQRTEPDPRHPELGVEWRMHPVDNPGDLLPNGLDPADVNGDGRDDYVTNYEAEGLMRVAFHPGPALRPGEMWTGVDVGAVRNAESSALGDLDGDGFVDVVGIHGVEGTDVPPGVRIYWGSRKPGVSGDAAFAWSDGGDIPSSRGGWHFLYVKTIDLDGDGDRDIVAGGRASRMAFGDKEGLESNRELSWAGIRWFENPGGGPDPVRELSRWRAHPIDESSRSGHGFEFGDLDGDGDLDLANANSDFDTPEAEENVVWYENPGPGRTLREPWPIRELYRSDEFYAKEQVLIADLDADGRNDVIVHAPERIYWFRNLGPSEGADAPIRFEQRPIEKHEATRWRARPLEAADLDADGDLDLIGALIHHEGALPSHMAAVFWMERDGDRWIPHVIKWADGFWGLNYVNGEKWDQMIPADVDGDGDVDLMANVEEYNRLESILAVVWFENPRL